MGLQTEIWIADIQENPIPDHSFLLSSVDKSAYVENNILHLQEAGIEPAVYENFFIDNPEGELPIANIQDIPHEVPLGIFSSEVTRHRRLEEVELAYNRRKSIVNRHKSGIAKGLGKKAAYAWSAPQSNAFNKLINLGANDSVIDGIIDLRSFYMDLDQNESLNLCLSPEHWARIRKEDKKLYKDLIAEKNKEYSDFKIHSYSQTPLYTADGVKKPYGSLREAGDKKCSFAWISTEVFRCFGETEMHDEPSAKAQATFLSFAKRALVGNIRANNPKYLATLI